MSSDLEHWNINATVFKDRVEEIHFVNDPAKNIRRQMQTHTWHVGQFLGRGGFGEVRLQQNNKTGKARAVKRITMAGNVLSKSECEKELEALLEFSKPKFKEAACFVEFYGWFTDGPEMFLAMEFVQLGDLEKNVMAHSGKIPESEARDIAVQILLGLEIMHAVKFAHRDLKPQNVMVVSGPPHWWVKLADFGLSKRLTETTGYHTRSGTQSYMAPEMLNYLETDISNPDYTNTVDMWAAGCIVYRVITGVVPFPPGTFLMKYCEDKSLFPYDQLIDNGAKSGVVRFLQELLATSPRERPSASQALQHAWVKTVLNIEKKPLPTSNTSEATTASLSELTISDIGYNTVSHYGLKSEAETSSAPNIRHTKFSSESSSYHTKLTEFPSQATIIQSPSSARETNRKPVVTQISSEIIHALNNSRKSEVEEHPGKSQTVLGQEMGNAKSVKRPAQNQKEQTKTKGKTLGTLFKQLTYESTKFLNLRLLNASENGDCTLVETFLDKGANIEATNGNGWTPLQLASFNGYIPIVRLLLDKGANIEAVDTNGMTPLRAASLNESPTIVHLLLDKGANTEAANRHWVTPLYCASSKGNQAIALLLLGKGANINAFTPYEGTSLHIVTFNGHQKMVQLLLDNGANTEAVNRDEETPLHIASYKGHQAIVKLLLDKGANVNVVNRSGNSPLQLASHNGHNAVILLLLEKGADASQL